MPTASQFIASQAIRQELARRGLRMGDLARQIGLNPEYVTNIVCGNSTSRRGRKLIEEALGIVAWPKHQASGAVSRKAVKAGSVKTPSRNPGRSIPSKRKTPKLVTRS